MTHYTVTRLHAPRVDRAIATRYSSLEAAWNNITPGTVVRDNTGAIVAGHADTLPWLTPANIEG